MDIHLTLDLTSARGLTLRVTSAHQMAWSIQTLPSIASRMRRGDSIVSDILSDCGQPPVPLCLLMQRDVIPEVMNIPDVEESHLDLRILVDRCMVEIFANGRNHHDANDVSF